VVDHHFPHSNHSSLKWSIPHFWTNLLSATANALAKAALVCPEPALPTGKVKIMFWGRWD
jgi:hypothetical protein